MLAAVKAYLETQGHSNIYTDYIPAKPDEVIGLFCWNHQPDRPGSQAGPRYVQVRVRRYAAEDARAECQAITALLDSGMDETPIPLSYPGKVVGWGRRFPVLMDRNDQTVTYYSEIALWGIN